MFRLNVGAVPMFPVPQKATRVDTAKHNREISIAVLTSRGRDVIGLEAVADDERDGEVGPA
jgi:hypothetical protein